MPKLGIEGSAYVSNLRLLSSLQGSEPDSAALGSLGSLVSCGVEDMVSEAYGVGELKITDLGA